MWEWQDQLWARGVTGTGKGEWPTEWRPRTRTRGALLKSLASNLANPRSQKVREVPWLGLRLTSGSTGTETQRCHPQPPESVPLQERGEPPPASPPKHSPWSLKRRCLGLAETLRCTLWEGEGALLLVRSAEGRGFKVMVSPSNCKQRQRGAQVIGDACGWTQGHTTLPDTKPPHTHMIGPCRTQVYLNTPGDRP